MTVQMVTTIHNYIGLSTDGKPTDNTVPIGSEFYESDTKKKYVWNGTDWKSKT